MSGDTLREPRACASVGAPLPRLLRTRPRGGSADTVVLRALTTALAYYELRERMQAEADRQQERCNEWRANGGATETTIHAAWLVALVLRALLERTDGGGNGGE